MARALIVSLLFVVASGCTSSFPPGSFDWGHGAAPLVEGQTRVQLGGGGGVGAGISPATASTGGNSNAVDVIGGGGGGVAVEHQLYPTLLVRGEGNMGCQSSGLVDNTAAVSGAEFICPMAVYVGGQVNPEADPNFALRLRVGAGADVFVIKDSALLPAPYLATQGAVVLSKELGDFEPYLDLHLGAKVGSLLAPVGTAGVTGGTEYHLNDDVSFYGLARGDVLFIAIFPSLSANVQAGALFTF